MNSSLENLIHQCTVGIQIARQKNIGTGFFVAPGLVLTCGHVVEAVQENLEISIYIYWNDNTYLAQIAKFLPPPYPDLCLLRLELTEHPCVYLLHHFPNLGDKLYSYGFPDQRIIGDPTTVEYEGSTGGSENMLKLKEGQVRPGMSGALLLNLRTGGVCGVIKTTRNRTSDLGGRAIPTSVILSHFEELAVQQTRFHQNDDRWISTLTPDQRRQGWFGSREDIDEIIKRNPPEHTINFAKHIANFQKRLQDHRRSHAILIEADGGMGKSTLLSLFLHICEENNHLSSYSELKFKNTLEVQDIVSSIARHTQVTTEENIYFLLRKLLTPPQKKCVILIDGVEHASNDLKEWLEDELLNLIKPPEEKKGGKTQLTNLIIVIAGQRNVSDFRAWKSVSDYVTRCSDENKPCDIKIEGWEEREVKQFCKVIDLKISKRDIQKVIADSGLGQPHFCRLILENRKIYGPRVFEMIIIDPKN